MREEIASLPLYSPLKRAEGEESASGEESPVLRRPSAGYLGMGEEEASCCEVSEIGGDPLGGGPPSSDGGGGGGGGCMWLGIRDCEEFVAQPASEKVGESVDINGGAGDRISEMEVIKLVQRSCSSLGEDNGVSVDVGNGSEFSVSGRKEGEEGCEGVLVVEEESGFPGLEQGPPVEALGDDSGASGDIGNGSEVSVLGRKEAKEGCEGVLVVEEESGLPGLEQGLPVEAPKTITEEEHDDFPGLSPLRTLGGDGLGGSSGIDIGLEVGYIGGMFNNDRVCNGCEDALLGSSGLVADCPLTKISMAYDKQANGFCCPPPPISGECFASSGNREATWMEEKCENLIHLEPEKMNSGQCIGNVVYSNECSREENHLVGLGTGQGLSLESIGSKKDQTEVNICGHSEESSTHHQEVVEGDGCQTSRVEREAFCSVQDSPNELVSCSSEGLASQKPSHLGTLVNDYSLVLSLAPDFKGSDADDVNGISTCRSNANSSCEEADNRGSADTKSSSIIVFRRTNPKRAASSRSSLTDGKSNHLTRTRNTLRKCKKTVGTSPSFSCSMIKISDKVTRKRSCSCRPARLSVWGAVENLTKIIKQSGELVRYDSDAFHVYNKRSKKGRSCGGRRKRSMAQKDESLQVSICNVVVDSQTSIKTSVDLMPTFGCRSDSGISNKVGEVKHKLAENSGGVGVRFLQRDGQHGDKDLESTLTQEISVDNIGECPGVSSRVGPGTLVETVDDMHSLDPGTSPDSDIYHPIIDVGIMTSEGATSTNQAVGTGHNVPVPYSNAFGTPASLLALDAQPQTNLKRGKKGKQNGECNGQPCPLSEHFIEEKLQAPKNLNMDQKPSRYGKSKQKKQGVSNEWQPACSKFIRKTTRKGSKCTSFPVESSVLGITELRCCEESMGVQNGLETCALFGQDVSSSQVEATVLTDKTKGRRFPRSTKPGAGKGGSSRPKSTRRRRQNINGKKKGHVQKSDNKYKTEEKNQTLDASLEAIHATSFSQETANKLSLTRSTERNGKSNAGSKVVPADVPGNVMLPVGVELPLKESNHSLEGQSLPPQVAWVLCDDCQKWRCITAALANTIEETNCKWTCKDNTDKAFADCLIPQEKTNAEINTELEISDEEDSSSAKPKFKGSEPSKLAASQRASWIPVKSNLFLHRNRKTQTIDEIMVCHCKPPLNGSLGCRDECLNRMLNIECVKGTCPCGDLCSNQQFQKRRYAKFEWFRCGKKGYGLQLQEDVSQGKFLIEYVGEVLDLVSYEARQRYYASRGQKHFYFMTLNGGEVIDACAKGNLGRFINHSCDPNCRTEKWMVNGEVCIGLFAIRDIKKGEEVTFDYNYVRVFGAAAKKCVCGSSECRGYIGGDPLNSEIIVQGDSDEEDLEPGMVREDSERELDVDGTVADAIDAKVVKYEEFSVQREDILIKCSPAILEPGACVKTEDTTCRPLSDVDMLDISLETLDPIQSEGNMCRPISEVELLGDSKQSLDSRQTEETTCKPVSDIQPRETSVQTLITTSGVLSDFILNSKKLISNLIEEKPNTSKPYPPAKSSRSSGTIKKSRSSVKSLLPHKEKKLAAGAGSGHFEGVEEKLNELLDEDGGISKRKDATKGYLKLLFVTAAGGDNVRGCATQSTRDLSLILDAILKTKSRMVLVDIINKNGLQMLHNIMKQNRGNFNRIPIIRKLLKVLEFLALKGILTPEHINRGPPCDGMESFKESILVLTRHNDMQVHQIARNFRDKWIPRTIRRVEPSDRDSGKSDSQRSYCSWFNSSNFKCRLDHGARETNAIICVSAASHPPPASLNEANKPGEASSLSQQVSISAPLSDNNSPSGTRTRKRKSRWDQPSDITSPSPHSLSSIEDQIVEAGAKFMKPTHAQPELTSQLEVSKQESEAQRKGISSCDEVATAKSSAQQNTDDEAPPGFGSPQKDNHPQVPSKIPVATGEVVMGQLQERYLSHLPVSYGIPAALLQHLGTPEAEGGNQCDMRWAVAPGMPFHPFPPLPPYPRGKPNAPAPTQTSFTQGAREEREVPSTSQGAADMVETGARNSKINERTRWASSGPGRRFFRPQRGNRQRFQRCGPSLPPQGNNCGFRGSIRNGASGLGVGDLRRDVGSGFCFPEGVSNDDVSSNYHQQPNLN